MGWKVKVKAIQSCLTLWSSAGQNTEVSSRSFLRWMFPSGDLPNPGIEPKSLSLQADSLPAEPPGKSPNCVLSSVQFSRSVVSDSLRPHELQHARPPCPSPTPGVYPNSCPLSWWCHPIISFSVVPFSSCSQSSHPLYWASQVALVGKWDAG